jgi:hypothetical protein
MMQIKTALLAPENRPFFERIRLGALLEEMKSGCKNGLEPYAKI